MEKETQLGVTAGGPATRRVGEDAGKCGSVPGRASVGSEGPTAAAALQDRAGGPGDSPGRSQQGQRAETLHGRRQASVGV